MAGWSAADIPDLAGKRAVVTGATSGIGLETAAALAGAGADVVLTGRDEAKGRAAGDAVRRRHPAARVRFAMADQASLDSLARFAAGLVEAAEPLDILVNNAGVMGLPRRQVTANGFERQFGTNHLGHFALTAQLIPLLLRAPAPRVVTVASVAHRRGQLRFDDLQGERHYDPFGAYAQAKLANLVFALELARRCKAAGFRIASIAAHPGFSRTNIFSGSLRGRLALLAAPLIGQSAAAGAQPILYAATAPAAANGGYYGPDRLGEMRGAPAPARIASRARDAATADRLWRESERLTQLQFPPP